MAALLDALDDASSEATDPQAPLAPSEDELSALAAALGPGEPAEAVLPEAVLAEPALAAHPEAEEEPPALAQEAEPPVEPEPVSATPTAVAPLLREPLRETPEVAATERPGGEAEEVSEFLQLTARLPKDKLPSPEPELEVDLASVAEDALAAVAPAPAPAAAPPRPPAPAPSEGLVYGDYRLEEKIAVGGMAEVFRAKRTGVAGFEKVVAVKRILPHLSFNKEFVDMFVDEAKMVAGLAHPNIVQIFDLGRIGTSYYIAMEYVHGADLRSILRRLKERELRMPLDIGVYVASRVAAALEHAHQKKDSEGRPMRIVHRDVSPQNILISFDGEVKLTDFGIAKAATKASTTEKGALRGKLMYMSPEQAWGRPMDHRSDLFSLGIVLYEMVTEQRPFLGSSEMGLLERVRRGSVQPPSVLNPQIPDRLERLVMTALQKEPWDRHRDAGEIHQELEAVLREMHPVTAKDLSRLMRILFEPRERGEPDSDALLPGQAADGVEVDLPGGEAPRHNTAPSGVEPALPRPMSLEELRRRFGPE